MHADIAAVIPCAIRIVIAVKSAVDDLMKAVLGMVEVEINQESRAQADDAIVGPARRNCLREKGGNDSENALLASIRCAPKRGEAVALQLLKRTGMIGGFIVSIRYFRWSSTVAPG